MNRIYFDNMSSRIWTTLLVLSMVFILFGSFELIDFESPRINNYISATGFMLQVIYFGRMFLYKNYVQWNKKGAVVKTNSWTLTSLRFDQIEATQLSGNKLVVIKKDGSRVTLDLSKVAEPDAQKLHEIIVRHSIASHV